MPRLMYNDAGPYPEAAAADPATVVAYCVQRALVDRINCASMEEARVEQSEHTYAIVIGLLDVLKSENFCTRLFDLSLT